MNHSAPLPLSAHASLQAWEDQANDMNPIIQKAAQQGCLAQGTLNDLVSDAGIKLPCVAAPVVLLTPYEPMRVPKFKAALPQFEGGEHTAIGDSAILYFSASNPGTPAYKVKLALPNSLALTYGQIVSLGGDFYGIPSAPIADGKTQAERMTLFTNAYNSLATDNGAASEVPKILAVMQEEITAVNKALANGQSASSVYKELGDTLSAKWNVITGGGSIFSDWYPLGRYLKLAAVNWDHFGQWAVLAYQAGHAVAIEQALAARSAPAAEQTKMLSWAYAMNAFADHFLSDLFSGGHIRTPRKFMYADVTPSDVGSLLSRAMHDEDCFWGLNTTNQDNNSWRAYGDKRYFDTVDLSNKALVDIAVQQSVDEVYLAFSAGTVPAPADYIALKRIPNLANASNNSQAQAAGNVAPLFVWNGNAVLRRKDVNNLNDYTWTDNWWGWSTLALLKKSYDPAPPQSYPQPPAAAPGISPNGWNSNQSVPPNWEPGANVAYAVSFVTSLYESNLGAACAMVTVGANQAYPTVTNIAVGPSGTVARRLYRRFASQTYTYVGQIGDNATTTFIDNTP